MIGVLRRGASVLLAILAFFGLFFAFSFPFLLSRQAATSQEYKRSFYDADRYVRALLDKGGKLPTDLDSWSGNQRYRLVALEATKSGGDCGPNFKMPKDDRFVLTFWRGEWNECYSSPSGVSTLLLSTSALLMSGLWIDLVIYLSVGLAASWLAWRIWPRPKLV